MATGGEIEDGEHKLKLEKLSIGMLKQIFSLYKRGSMLYFRMSREKFEFFFKQDLFYYFVKIFCIWLNKAAFIVANCCSCERCGRWASCYYMSVFYFLPTMVTKKYKRGLSRTTFTSIFVGVFTNTHTNQLSKEHAVFEMDTSW